MRQSKQPAICRKGGRIIIIGSVNGDRMPVMGMAAYAASKSALQGLARGPPVILAPADYDKCGKSCVPLIPTSEDGPMKELIASFMAIKTTRKT